MGLRLHLLQHCAKLKFPSLKRDDRREQFDAGRKNREALKPCWLCLYRADVLHHVITVANGGTNKPVNLVPLCHGCHSKVHPWLKIKTEH